MSSKHNIFDVYSQKCWYSSKNWVKICGVAFLFLEVEVLFLIFVIGVKFFYYLHDEVVFAGFYSVAFHAWLRGYKKNGIVC